MVIRSFDPVALKRVHRFGQIDTRIILASDTMRIAIRTWSSLSHVAPDFNGMVSKSPLKSRKASIYLSLSGNLRKHECKIQ
jgi:hypothetical protein